MNVEKRANIIKDWIENYCKNESYQPKALVVGISGGIDSSVVSTLRINRKKNHCFNYANKTNSISA